MYAVIMLILAGRFGGFAHIATTLAFQHAEASLLASFEYLALVWPLLADMLLFDAPLSLTFITALPHVLAGAAMATVEGRSKTNASGTEQCDLDDGNIF